MKQGTKNLDYLWVLVDHATLEYTTGVSTTQEQKKKKKTVKDFLGYKDPKQNSECTRSKSSTQ